MNSVLIIKLFTQAVRNVDEAIYLVFSAADECKILWADKK